MITTDDSMFEKGMEICVGESPRWWRRVGRWVLCHIFRRKPRKPDTMVITHVDRGAGVITAKNLDIYDRKGHLIDTEWDITYD